MRKNQEDKFQKLEKRIAAPEVKVQEQNEGNKKVNLITLLLSLIGIVIAIISLIINN